MSSDASALMGPLLLKGWAMTAESCEVDYNPLMKDMKNGGSVCVSCENKLAKLIAVEGYRIVPDGLMYLLENDSKTV